MGLIRDGEAVEGIQEVHPHIRGVNGRIEGFGGLSSWFIPTYVGLILYLCSQAFRIAVHPHIRGVNAYALVCTVDVAGSSPHTWG